MRKFLVFLFLSSAVCLAQSAKPANTKAPNHPAVKTAAPAKPAATASVSQAEVESFLQHMFGFQAGATWKVLDISPVADMPGVTRVVVQLGNQSQALYIMPGGTNAIVGEVLPFGADPFAAARKELAANAHGPVSGKADAVVTVVEFSDMQCPHCKVAQPIIEKLMAESPEARLVYQPFPLPMHPWAMQAAEYADCVNQTNHEAFWKFVDSVYEAQAEITEANATEKLNGLSSATGADAGAVAQCALKAATADAVKKSMELGIRIGVNSTPTLFIQGRQVLGVNNEALPSLKAMIDYEAKQLKK